MKRFNVISLIVASIATIVLALSIFINWDNIKDVYNIPLLILWMLSFLGVAVLSFFDKQSKWLIVPIILTTFTSSLLLGLTGLSSVVQANTLVVILEIGFYVALVFALFKKQKWACIYTIVYFAILILTNLSLLQAVNGVDDFYLEYAIIANVLLLCAEIVFFIKPLYNNKAEAIASAEESESKPENALNK